MTLVFMATLGQRPEAITIAFDLLSQRLTFDKAVLIYTAGVPREVEILSKRWCADYPMVTLYLHEIGCANGKPLHDVDTVFTAQDYFDNIMQCLLDYQQTGGEIHLLVSGGRKAMSIYATLAAALIFTSRDKVWTVLSPPQVVEQKGIFHLSAKMQEKVQLVALPLLTTRGRLKDAEKIRKLVELRQNPRSEFLNKLSQKEQKLVEILAQHPDASNEELAKVLDKSIKTIETQLSTIYGKMVAYLDFGESVQHKRQTLIELLNGRI